MRTFWAEHKTALPLHYSTYVAEVGCKKSASANVESVFSGAGKFMEEAKTAGLDLLEHMVKQLHYNWKYAFVRPTMDEIIERYNAKFNYKSKPDAADVDVVASAIVAGHNAS